MRRAVRALPLHEAQGHEAEAAGKGGVGLDPVEPGAGAVFIAGGGGLGPDE